MGSLFSMVARYVPTTQRSPREDMLTQAFAATLESADGLASHLVSEWIRDGGGSKETAPSTALKGQPEITPQRSLRTGERVDLELDFRRDGSGEPDLLLWVEVKHQAHLSGSNQLRKYADALECEPHTHKRLVFLPPAGYAWASDEWRPSELCETSWQRVGEILRIWRRDQDESSRQVWIVNQFLEFLEEERLFMSHPLTNEQLRLLREAPIAESRFNALVEDAQRQIDDWVKDSGLPSSPPWHQWPKRGSLRWPEFWRTYGSVGILDGDAWFEWSFRTPEDHSIFQGLGVAEGPVFGAGLTVGGKRIDELGAALVAEGLRFVPQEGGLPRVFRYTTVESLLEGAQGSLSEQAGALVEFVQTAFESVERALSLPRQVP